MSTSNRTDRKWMLAACAVALATAVGSNASASQSPMAINQIERYCATSWRNAGIRPQEWDDCTQQALTELLEIRDQAALSEAIERPESEARRDLNRAIWRLVQRNRRHLKCVELMEGTAVSPPAMHDEKDWAAVERIAETCLTPRQIKILELSRAGWRVNEIADELESTPARISDEKYKAIAKLRKALA